MEPGLRCQEGPAKEGRVRSQQYVPVVGPLLPEGHRIQFGEERGEGGREGRGRVAGIAVTDTNATTATTITIGGKRDMFGEIYQFAHHLGDVDGYDGRAYCAEDG